MDKSEIEQKVNFILAGELGIDINTIAAETRLIEDLGVDSINTLKLGMIFEDEFNIEIEDEDAYKMRMGKQIIVFVANHIDKQQKKKEL